jgi:hypothetical protein
LRNCASLKKKKISFVIYGNSNNIKLFVKLPREFETFFKNTFYANFSTSDLEQTNIKPWLDEKKQLLTKKYINFAKNTDFNDRAFFTKDGSYMDPMRDILALFSNVI